MWADSGEEVIATAPDGSTEVFSIKPDDVLAFSTGAQQSHLWDSNQGLQFLSRVIPHFLTQIHAAISCISHYSQWSMACLCTICASASLVVLDSAL